MKSTTVPNAGATAGFLNTDWNPRDVPPGTVTTNVVLRTADQAATGGSLYRPAMPTDTVICVMHPREFMACHYLIPDIVGAGYAAWSQSPRSVGNDLRLEHEFALHDVAAGLQYLRAAGFKRIVLLGNSGGAGLYALYVQQAALPGAQRIARTPGGRPTQLADLDMPVVDGFVLVGPHPGQGALLLNCIDPSVADENDPLSVDPSLDPLSPANGYAGKGDTRYSAEFIERYRAAQQARVARIDAHAQALIARRQAARQRVKDAAANGARASAEDRRLAGHTPIFNVWRTDADLRCFDLTLDASDRKFGSLWGADPYASNYGAVGFARQCTPESWLSTWSALSSNASLAKTAASITQPVLVIEYTGDQACFPGDVQRIVAAIASPDRQHLRVRGDHHGRALSADEAPGRLEAGRLLADWLRTHFPL
ncbi:alpha/beta hydrolase [Burkholderia aenigmatica]|uniref:Alpha/beta hydrolase n=1 Tax=Burkholderia aenigmatica TaxID=2015348 RepID=A0A6J5IYY6_9BURK|nr:MULTISPECIES: alpha/beta hydrolase [Burkholderia]AYQ39598.1 alpha/beta hydrolase [Burkholderia lata]CAB3964569.1 alpha/beta hydrolase [Burkholderia aenigmatica]VWC53027.1 alpha/beta hydrolase [Burkholderia aenigmatica]